MRKRKQEQRVLGPYPHGKKWRVFLVERDGTRVPSLHESEASAEGFIRDLRAELEVQEVTVGQAVMEYEVHLRTIKERKPVSVTRTLFHLHSMMTDETLFLSDITPKCAAQLYDDLCKRVSKKTGKVPAVDSQRNTLNECGTFGRWAAKKGYLPADPWDAIEARGKRKQGKPQLRLDEARKLLEVTLAAAYAGDRGALVVALLLLTGFRASEAGMMEGRDVDDDGRLLWTDGKTGKRRMETPDVIVDILRVVAAEGGSLWPKSDRYWVYRQTRKWCKRAGVAVVTPHGLRGTHSTLAQEHGATSHVVASALGHGVGINQRAYTVAGTADQAKARRTQKLLRG
jgi:integrase